jgi:hypothetical protein
METQRRKRRERPAAEVQEFDETEFRRSLSYRVSSAVETVLSDMTRLRTFDREQEKKGLFWKWMAVLGGVSLMTGGICLFAEHTRTGMVLNGIGLPLTVIGVFFLIRYRRRNLDNRRYELVFGLLSLLRKDMAAAARVNVAIDFTPHIHKSRLARTGKVGPWDTRYFVHPWLQMTGVLVDGTRFTLKLIERHQDRHKVKINPRGKRKHKSKTKISSEAILTLKVRLKRYPGFESLSGGLADSLRMPPWVQLKAVNANGRLLTLRTTTRSSWNVPGSDSDGTTEHDGTHWIAVMFLNLYGLLDSAR